MSEMQEQPLPTIRETLVEQGVEGAALDVLERALVAREDRMADILRGAGAQFGMYPQIVAEVFTSVGVGSPVSEEERAMIHNNFVVLMTQMQAEYLRQMGQQPPDEPTN